MTHQIFLNLKLAGFVALTTLLASCGSETKVTSNIAPPTTTQAARILTQATFGPTVEDINRIQNIGTGAWFNEQFTKPQTMHFAYVNQALSTWPANTTKNDSPFIESFWQQAVNGDDQLRQRVTFALSQIFVISFQNDTLATMPRGVASYYDMLGSHAFGNFRNLLESVTLHPMMGNYLSALRNQKTVGARVPDENYAREIMQLFTIGLRKLNQDGTDAGGVTYVNNDIKGLAKVFTGWSWAGADKSNTRFNSSPTSTTTATVDPNRDWLPMQNYPQYHELLQKNNVSDSLEIPKSVLYTDQFNGNTSYLTGQPLGVLIPDNTSGEASLKIALDTLFNHPNVGPFIGRQLIQRLVTDNPSPAYISRVAAAFNNNGQGVRGDMKAVIQAIVTDTEALSQPTGVTTGKLREPVIRLANWMRAFNATSASGKFLVGRTDDPLRSLSQTAMRAPTVFNFYRPEYQAPFTTLTSNSLFAPEMQITDEISTFGYLDYMRNAVPNGVGTNREVKANYSAELALVSSPDLLLDRISLLLLQNNMTSTLRDQIKNAMASNNSISAANKVNLAVFLTMASPEYITQK